MSEYTAEDFKNARFADHKDGRVASKAGPGTVWHTIMGDRMSDGIMANTGWRPVHESTPLTLDTLAAAWENAIGTTAVYAGDTIIQRDPIGESFSVFKADRDYPRPPLDIRVLRRAPRREPWEDLADVLADMGHLSPTGTAMLLHARGVRVTGGDDDE